jgi:hypothetical protein
MDARVSLKSPAQLVQEHWKFILRITNDEDEAQQLALYLLEKFDQFKPKRAAFAAFIRMKMRELRQHYSDKGVVYHPCRKESGGYVSFDEVHTDEAVDGAGDDEEVECSLYNLIAALPPLDMSPELLGVYYEETRSRRPAYCQPIGDLGRCPDPVKLRPRHKRVSPEQFRRERINEAAYAPKVKSLLYLAGRAAGIENLPKDRLWESEVPEFLAAYWKKALLTFGRLFWDVSVERRSGGRWHKYKGAYLRSYLARNGLALRLPARRLKPRPTFLSWVRDQISATAAIPRENTDLLWAALRVLCYKRGWPRGIPKKRLFPEDRYSPRGRLLFQAQRRKPANPDGEPLEAPRRAPYKNFACR